MSQTNILLIQPIGSNIVVLRIVLIAGIVDNDRCFMMDLNPDMVLMPEVLVLSIEEGAKFDISRVRSTLRAALPAVQQLAAAARRLHDHCAHKPTYRLEKEEFISESAYPSMSPTPRLMLPALQCSSRVPVVGIRIYEYHYTTTSRDRKLSFLIIQTY